MFGISLHMNNIFEYARYMLYKALTLIGLGSASFREVAFRLILIALIVFVILICFIYLKHLFILHSNNKSHEPKNPVDMMYLALMLDMKRRGAEPLKIAQTIMFASDNQYNENQILQIVFVLEDFLEMNREKQFKPIIEKYATPSIEDAIKAIIDGSIFILLDIMNAAFEDGVQNLKIVSKSEKEKYKKYVANIANIYGCFVSLVDTEIAISCFETATKLNKEDMAIWVNLADAYFETNDRRTASSIYQSVIENADHEKDALQVANARKKLATISNISDEIETANLFYDSIGINKPLDEDEIRVLKIMRENQNKTEIASMLSRM